MTDAGTNAPSRLIAVVDDDESIRESLPALLGAFGLTVDTFCSAEVFLSSWGFNAPDCLILDVSLPGISGPQLQRELKTLGYHIPVVFISALGDEPHQALQLEASAVDYLPKPFSEEALLRALRKALCSRSRTTGD
jgi:FixJ family two-component response regulator